MGILKNLNDSIGFSMRDINLRVEAYGKDCIRVRETRNNVFSEEKWTLLDCEETEYEIKEEKDNVTIICGELSAVIRQGWKTYNLSIYKNGRLILQSKEDDDAVTRHRHLNGDNYCIKELFETNEGEHFYGLGQEQQDFFDRKGGSYELVHYNTKSTIPVVFSSLGYAFIWNNPSPGHCELVKNHTLWQSECAYQADYIVVGGKNPKEIMTNYCKLTGFAPKLPEWAMGFWQSRLRYESQEDVLNIAKEYVKRGVSIDALVIDYFHWTEQGEWSFDKKLWPDPKTMCEELKKMHIEPVVSIWPTINPKSRNYEYMNEQNMLVRTENGQYGSFEFYGQQAFVDMTNPDTRSFVWNQARDNYYKHGIKTFWLDEAEPEFHPQQFDNYRFYLGNGAKVALLYPFYYVKAFTDGLQSEGEKDFVSLTRAAYIGSQRLGAVVWNGDIPSTFRAMKQSVVSGLSMSMCGIPWWSNDIGGFHSGDTESEYFRELIVRWFQFGVFSPVMRLHGLRNKTKNQAPSHPDILEPSGGANEIWSFGEANYPILKQLVELRQRLRPYIKEQMEKSVTEGIPVVRPLFFDYYNDEICYGLDDEYLFGPDIIFAPILEKGMTDRKVYIPEGRWIRNGGSEVVTGPCEIDCHADLNEYIAFVHDGAKVKDVL